MDNRSQYHSYTLILEGHLDDRWSDWFPGMTILRLPRGLTLIAGSVVDQAALHGMLSRVGDLGISLIMVLRGNFTADPNGQDRFPE